MEQQASKTGLVLEGGAMRGLFTAGVLDVFMERRSIESRNREQKLISPLKAKKEAPCRACAKPRASPDRTARISP